MTAIKKSSVTEQIAEYLRKRIESGDWKVGCLIPSEAKLTAELGVSRSSLRSAISRFAALGILKAEQGKGCYLMSSDVSSRFGTVGVLRHSDYVDIIKVLKFRLLIEPYAAQQCALLPDGQRSHLVDQLAHSLVKMRECVNHREDFVAAATAFHSMIAGACGNELIAFALDEVFSVTPRTAQQMNVAFGYDTGLYFHEKILEAVSLGDGTGARQCMKKHLQTAIDTASAK